MDTTGPQYNMPQSSYNSGGGVPGAIAGAIAGATGDRVEPQGHEIRVPADSVITFRLQEPMHIVGYEDPAIRAVRTTTIAITIVQVRLWRRRNPDSLRPSRSSTFRGRIVC